MRPEMMRTTCYRLLAPLAALAITVSPGAGQSKPLPGLQTGTAPWTRGLEGLGERLEAIGLPAMPREEFVQHIHQHLTITIRGAAVTVPGMIGINPLANYISPIHTHAANDTIHIEAATKERFNLGQFFDVWGVRFNSQCIGGYCNKGPDSLRVTVNDQAFKGDPRSVPLQDREEIRIVFGRSAATKAEAGTSLRKRSQPPRGEPK